jgi:HJR/Mrr/RecB family endonuclease
MARRSSRPRKGQSVVAETLFGCAIISGFAAYVTFVSHANLLTFATFTALCMASVAGLASIFIWRQRQSLRLLRRLHTLDDLLALTPTQFERIIGELLQTLGYTQVKHTGGAGDLAADLTCRAPDGRSVVVQCKRYARKNPVGSPEVQKFIGMMAVHHRADTGIFVTTSSFTQPAQDLCKRHGIRAITGEELADALTRMTSRT